MMIRSVSAGNICLSKSCVNVPNALPRNRMVSSYLSDYVLHTKRSFYKIQNRCDKILPYPSKDIYNLRIRQFSNYIDFKETYFLFLQQVYKKVGRQYALMPSLTMIIISLTMHYIMSVSSLCSHKCPHALTVFTFSHRRILLTIRYIH